MSVLEGELALASAALVAAGSDGLDEIYDALRAQANLSMGAEAAEVDFTLLVFVVLGIRAGRSTSAAEVEQLVAALKSGKEP